MKTNRLLITFLLAGLALSACRNTDKTTQNASDSTVEETITDTTGINRGADLSVFFNDAALAGLKQIALGKAAQEKATNAKVKKYGENMAKVYTDINAELKTLAESKKIALPTALSTADKQHIEEMKKMSTADFEKHYMSMIEKEQLKALDLFKSAAVSGDAKIRNFASTTLRTVERQFKEAGEITNGSTY